MTYNLTENIIFKEDMSQKKIKEALNKTISIFLDFYKLKEKDIPEDFSSTIFRNHVGRNAILIQKVFNQILDNDIVKKDLISLSFELNQMNENEDLHKKIKNLFAEYDIEFNFTKEYSSVIVSGLSVFLLVLHFEKLIHLPFSFNVPYTLQPVKSLNYKKRFDFAINYYPKMFRELRNIDIKNKMDSDSEIMSCDNKELLISYGTRLFIALGWKDFSDVSIDSLLEFNKIAKESTLNRLKTIPPYSLMITFFKFKFSEDFPVSTEDWKKAYPHPNKTGKTPKVPKIKGERKKYIPKELDFSIVSSLFETEDENLLIESLNIKYFNLEALDKLALELVNYSQSIENWQILEKSYINKRKLENYKTINTSLSYFNTYLFLILPKWYKNNQSKIKYPQMPFDLKAGIFISRLIQSKENLPPTFLEGIQKIKQLKNEYIYVILKNIEGFFEFLQIYSEELPGCKGFIQPISSLDFPKVTKSKGTNKGLIPRHLFGYLLSYIDTIRTYNELVLENILNNKFDTKIFRNNIPFATNFIDTIKLQDIVGYVPIIYVNNKKIVLKEIPNMLNIRNAKLKDGRVIDIPYPHILNHIVVVLQTGLRSNHIQWLDAEKFNCAIKPNDQNSFVPLYVNTDKSKTQAWTPIVSRKVIEILNSQLEWRKLIDNPQFNEKKFYNNNTKTKWESFYPLFSYNNEGLPYADKFYYDTWMQILENFQILIKQTSLKQVELGKKLPKGISFNEFNLDDKLKEYGKSCENVCELRFTSDITPHSARVSVVSHYITALPAEVIGQYITGQTEAVVHHYTKLDPEYLTEIENEQKDSLQRLIIQKEFNNLTGKEKSHPILADKENSNLAQSMKINKEQTIARYGCVSLSLKEDGNTGIDIILKESNTQLAYNKTEICPYNNQCPSDLIKELKGFRRCGMCPYAVRSIDHLPAIAVKKRQMLELMEEIEVKLNEAIEDELNVSYSVEDIDRLEDEKQRIAEELLGWIVSEEMLEANRKIIQDSGELPTYMVKKPEILIENLQLVSRKENDIEYLLTRLNDCESFPTLESPLIRAKFDLLRRQLLAKTGDFIKAFDSKLPANPAYECLGLLKSVIERHGLSQEQVIGLLSTNVLVLPNQNKPLLELGYGKED